MSKTENKLESGNGSGASTCSLVIKAGFHEGRNMHLCEGEDAEKAVCGMLMSSGETCEEAFHDECCEECLRLRPGFF